MTSPTEEHYYRVASRLLADHGSSGITIAAMSREVGVTSGSFYHHFGSWDGFVDGYLKRWEREQTERIVEVSSAPENPRDRLAQLIRLAGGVPHATEAATRAWANSELKVAAYQTRVDERRMANLHEVIGALITDRQAAKTMTHVAHAGFVGLQLLQRQINPRETKRVFVALQQAILDAADRLP